MECVPRFLCEVMLARLARYLRTADRKITEHKAAKRHVIQLPLRFDCTPGSRGGYVATLTSQEHSVF